MTLAMKDEIMSQIRLDHNIRLETWIFLDWAGAYLMLHEVEEGVKAAFAASERNCRALIHPLPLAELHISYEPREKRLPILCINDRGFLAHSHVKRSLIEMSHPEL